MLNPSSASRAEAWPPPLLRQGQQWPQGWVPGPSPVSGPQPTPPPGSAGSAQPAQATLLLELLGDTRCPHRDRRPRSSVSQRDRSQPRVCIHTHPPSPPPLINKSRTVGPRPPESPIGSLAGPAGCRTTPLAPAPAHQRGPSHCLQSVAFCSAPTWRGRIRTGTPAGPPPPPPIWVKPLNARDPLTVPGLLMPLTARPAPGAGRCRRQIY